MEARVAIFSLDLFGLEGGGELQTILLQPFFLHLYFPLITYEVHFLLFSELLTPNCRDKHKNGNHSCRCDSDSDR